MPFLVFKPFLVILPKKDRLKIWYWSGGSRMATLMKLIPSALTRETSTGTKPTRYGTLMPCPFCEEAYIRTANRAVTCGKPECYRDRKAMNKQSSRKKQKTAALKSDPDRKMEE